MVALQKEAAFLKHVSIVTFAIDPPPTMSHVTQIHELGNKINASIALHCDIGGRFYFLKFNTLISETYTCIDIVSPLVWHDLLP